MEYVNKEKDIYIFPDVDPNYCIVYSPLRGIAFRVAHEAESYIIAYVEEENRSSLNGSEKLKKNIDDLLRIDFSAPSRAPHGRNSVVFIPTQKCNLGCSYCYAHMAHAAEDISFESIRSCVDYLFSNGGNETKRVSFIGGGEPMLKWDLIKKTVEYIDFIKKDSSVQISIATNGTRLTPDIVKFIKENHIKVSVSFDILPEIQNVQRPYADKSGTFHSVDKNLRLLLQEGIVPNIRATITQASREKMTEMTTFVHEHYPQIRQIHLEHVSDASVDAAALEEYYHTFCSEFWKARSLGKQYGINVKNSLTTALQHLRYTFCGGEFCVTPKGQIVSCHRISSERDTYFDNVCYGEVQENTVHFSKDLDLLCGEVSGLDGRCESCFARWHCAGGCPYNRLTLDSQQLDLLCDFTKTMITHGLSSAIPSNLQK